MTPFDDLTYIVNSVLLGKEPTIEDFILLIGTIVAFVAFILWCCFPIQPKDAINHRQFSCKSLHSLDATTQVQNSYTKSSTPFVIQNDYHLRSGSINNCCNAYSISGINGCTRGIGAGITPGVAGGAGGADDGGVGGVGGVASIAKCHHI